MDNIKIVYADLQYIESFHETLHQVAQEKIYLELIAAPELELVKDFQGDLIEQGAPVFYAIEGDQVVGWCDISPLESERLCHRGSLGMGLLASYRGKGIGSLLMEASLKKAQLFGLEKVELQVYTNNISAITLYQKFGFVEEGLITKYRKYNNQYFDSLLMAKFL